MTEALPATDQLDFIEPSGPQTGKRIGLPAFLDLLGISMVSSGSWPEKLPFAPTDITAGTENELQVAVAGRREKIDLAQSIERSNYFKNIVKRVASGDAPRKILSFLESYLSSSGDI